MSAPEVITVDLARPGEAPRLARLSRDQVEQGLAWRWRAPRLKAMMAHPDSVVLAARVAGQAVGFAVMVFHARHAHLNLLAVEPAFQRRGIARALLDWLVASSRVAGIAVINLEVRRDNIGAITFYERLGFHRGAVQKGYYDGREDALAMQLVLIPPEQLAHCP